MNEGALVLQGQGRTSKNGFLPLCFQALFFWGDF